MAVAHIAPSVAERAERSGLLWARLGLAAILLLAALLRLWHLDRNGWGSEYYSAGVRSMAESWHNFFFNAFDPAGFISLDKPPLAFWIQVGSVKLFGFTGLAVLLPQALEGVASVVLLHHLVRRRFGVAAGLLAALFLALMPLAVAVDRSSNTDSCLLLALLLAAWAGIVAAERSSWRLLLVALALVGLAFNVKMAAALVVLPAIGAAWLVCAHVALPRRIAWLAVAGVAFLVVALCWIGAYDLTPPEQRPFVGSSHDNSMIELAIGHNALERFVHRHRHRTEAPPVSSADAPARDTVPAGPLRLVDPRLASQIGWLLPLALLGAVAAWRAREGTALPSLLLLSGWALTGLVIYSAAGGIFHGYYLLPLAPAVCGFAALGVTLGLREARLGAALPLALFATAGWQVHVTHAVLDTAPAPDWLRALDVIVVTGAAVALAGLVPALLQRRRGLLPGAIGTALALLLVMPGAWALSSTLARGGVEFPQADLRRFLPAQPAAHRHGRGEELDAATIDRLLVFLDANRRGATYLLATLTARQAAPIILLTGDLVMAVGGYSGSDITLSPAQLAARAAKGEVRYMLVTLSDPVPGADPARQVHPVVAWLQRTARPVDPALWRVPATADGGERHRRLELFELTPR